MQKFKKIVGLLLCLAMVLSILPASIVAAAELGAETEQVMQKIDLTDCIVAACSNNFNSSLSYRDQDWYTDGFSDFNSEWKDFGALVDGYYYNEVYFGCTSPERADLYIDLTEKYGGAVPLDQLKVYHGGFGAVPSLFVALVLEDGTVIEESFTLGWEAGVDADPLTWTFDETYAIEGVYIWQSGNNVKAYFGEIELLALEEVQCEVVEIVNLDAPTFGYYADGDTDGAITEYYDTSYGPANLIDGDHDTYTRSLSYTYSEIQNEEKIPAILFDLGEEFSLAGVEVNGYQYGYYNMCDFTIQVYDSTGTWTTVKTVKKAFDTSAGTAGEDTEPVMYRFDAIVGSKVRILVNGVNDMGDEDPDQKVSIDGFCVREIALYNGYGEAPEDESETDKTPSILDNLIVMESAPTPTVGYYTDNNTDGTITDYHHSTYVPANMVNGDITDQSRSEYYTHAEIASGAKVPVILFDFGSTTVLGGMDIYGYQTSRYNMEDFEVQVYTSEGWVTAASVTDAFYKEGSFGDDLSGPLTVEFDQLYTTTKLRILVSGISDMSADGAEDAEMLEGGYIRIREIEFYSEEAPGPYIETANLNGVDLSEYVIVYSADEPDYNLRAAQHIRSAIKKRTGRVLTIVEDDTAEVDCEILVGDTNRSLSQSVTAPANNVMKFTIQTSGTKIALEADYFIIAGAAYYFTETYIDDANFDVTVSDVTRAPITEKANNYIMLIGDGMGVNQTKLFEAYDVPTSGDFAYSDGEDIFYGYYLPYFGLVETCNSSGTTTDSAAAGTALATGYKTVNTWVGLDKNGNSVQNLTELALSLGMGAAVMSTEEITGATPAAFSSHVSERHLTDQILAAQAELRADGAIIPADDYYPYYTAEEWASAEPTFIKALNQVAENDSFFLMYEEAYIDKNGHYSNAPWCFRTVYRFNQAIGFFMEFAMYNPDTLVVITADHETGNMDSSFTFDGNGSHSSQDVPIFAYGVGASAFDTDSSYHNTSIARTFAYMMTGGDTSFGDSQWPILTASDEEPVEPEDPDATEPTTPTTEPVTGTMQKIDLTGTVAGICSSPYSSSVSYANQNWYSSQNAGWRDLSLLVDGNLTNEVHFGLSDGERADMYLDLTKKNGSAISADQFKLYYGGYKSYAINSVTVILELANGTQVTKQFATNWGASNTDPLVWTFDQTYELKGIYVWADSVLYGGQNTLTLAEAELYVAEGGSTTEPTTPPATEPTEAPTQAPDAPVVNPEISGLTEVSGVPTPVIGYYTDINGTITSYTHDTYGPANLVNGDTTDQARSGYFTHAEIAAGTKTPAILFNLGSEKTLGAIEIYGYQTSRYNMEDFEVQVYVDGAWKTVTATVDAFYVEGSFGDDLTAPVKLYFDNLYTTSQVRILVSGLSDMTEDGAEDAEMINGSYIRAREIKLYEKVGGTTEPTEPEVTEPTTPPATEPEVTEPTTPVAPSDPIKQGTILQIVPASKLTTVFGYYSDGTGADEATFVDGTDGYCVTDGWYGRAGYSECTSAQGKIALVMTVNGTINLGGMEIVAHETTYDPVDFDVQALVNGQWVTVYSQDTNAFASDRTVMFDFGTSVTTSKVRILVNSVVGGTSTQCRLKEVTLYESTTGNVSQIIDLTGKGSSTDAGAATPITNLTDGDKSTNFIATNALFDLTVDGAPTAIDGFNLYCFRSDGNPFPSNVLVQIQKTAGGEFETIGTFSTGWTSGAIADALTAKFDQTYMAYGIRFAFDKWNYMNELELYAYERETASSEPSQALVGASYSIRLLEPWALRTFVTFATGTATNPSPIQLADIKSYGAYAIIEHKFDGTTVEDLIADADTKAYTSAAGTIVPGGDDEATTVVFDFTDEIYTHRLGEKVYWVAYYEDAEGQIHYTSLKSTTVIAVAETVAGQDNVSDKEKAVLDSMQVLKDAVVAFRGEDADLGNTAYEAGVSITDSGISFNQDGAAGTYLFGTSYQIRLIEPWSIRVDMAVLDAAANASFNFAAENVDYGMIFFHDRTGAYADGMSIEEMLAEGNALVYSKGTENIELGAESAIATYAEGIYTYELDTNLYCLPYVEVDGQYYYRSSVISWNLLEAMETYSQNTTLSAEEVAVFEAMLDLHAKTIAYRGN